MQIVGAYMVYEGFNSKKKLGLCYEQLNIIVREGNRVS
jgi:hypothetical protein